MGAAGHRARVARTYDRFAKYYDIIYHDLVDYEGDCDYLEKLFRKFLRRRPASILDLGCGTGNHAIILARRGYEITGLDLSESQLRVGHAKLRGTRLPVTLLRGDMRRFDLRRRFEAAIAMFGGFGYLLSNRDVLSHFRCVRRHLEPDGLYSFEFWQEPGAIPGHRAWLHREKPFRLIRLDESRLDRRRHRLTMDFQFFAFEGDRLRERFSESHTARVYAIPEMRKLLARSGFRLLAAHGGTPEKKGFRPAGRDAFRVMAVAKPVR